MTRQQITIVNKLGLHTRAAAKLVDTARRYQSKIELIHKDRSADCKSIMSVITFGAHKGTVFDIVVSGDDESEALYAVATLINERFGESE